MYAYIRVCEDLIAKIKSGILQSNDKLPTEKEMCETYQVSISTVRKSMYYLRDKGLIYSKRGSGYYVAEKRPDHSNLQQPSLSKLGTNANIKTEIVKFEVRRASLQDAKQLKIKVNELVYEIIRKRLVNDELYMIEINLIPVGLIPDLLESQAINSLNQAYVANNIERVKVKNNLMWFDSGTIEKFKITSFNDEDVKFNLVRKLELLDGDVVEYSQILIFADNLNFEYIHLY